MLSTPEYFATGTVPLGEAPLLVRLSLLRVPEHPEYFTTGAGPLGEAPLLARGPRADPILRGAGDVPLHQRGGAPLRPHNIGRHLLNGRQVDDDGAVDEGDHHHHAEHDGEEHAEAEPLLPALRRQLGFRHGGKDDQKPPTTTW